MIRSINHAQDKYNVGSWVFDTTTAVIDDKKKIPSIMHKVTVAKLHPYHDRLLTVGEILYCMGMPTDYHIYGQTFEKSHQTGQNVPVNTARYIVSEIVRVLNDWDTERRNTNGNPFFGDDDNVEYVDNTKQTYSCKPTEK
jgi:site-specific DNA-cytosine methylase